MRLDQSSVDISTLVEKIRRKEIDLQPDFQRGQVWPESKKKRLIDTILRGWYIPAIHLVVNDALDREEVLDGQQRLRAILEFMNNQFTVDGRISPTDSDITILHNAFYDDLPDRVRSRFRRFTIATVRLRDYRPEEPGELFFRLNQLTALTAAEQRNALIGEPRNEIRSISVSLEHKLGHQTIGFSNARMNYDDALSRLAVALEIGGLHEKITAARLEHRYRKGQGFSDAILSQILDSVEVLHHVTSRSNFSTRFNKASLFSWLYFFSDHEWSRNEKYISFVSEFFYNFESTRNSSLVARFSLDEEDLYQIAHHIGVDPIIRECLTMFNDRASSRVNDVSSVLLRDLCLNVVAFIQAPDDIRSLPAFHHRWNRIQRVIQRMAEMPNDLVDRSFAEATLTKLWDIQSEIS